MDLTRSAELSLDTVACGKEIMRLEIGVDLEDDVQEVVLLGTTDRSGFPDARAALHADPRFFTQLVERALKRLEAATDVRAEPEEGLHGCTIPQKPRQKP